MAADCMRGWIHHNIWRGGIEFYPQSLYTSRDRDSTNLKKWPSLLIENERQPKSRDKVVKSVLFPIQASFLAEFHPVDQSQSSNSWCLCLS